jgi:hypothetical protein
MQRMDDAAFLGWLAEAGIDSAPPRGGGTWLHFAGAAEGARTWPAPGTGDALSAWLAAVVRAASAEGSWWLWPRGGGGWFGGFSARDQIHAGALGFAPGEEGPMMRILHAFAAWPWGGSDDLYLVPEDRSCIVMLCHDEEIHVHAADPARLHAFADALKGAS